MMFVGVFALLVLCGCVLGAWWYLWSCSRYVQLARKIPGPKTVPLLGNLTLFTRKSNTVVNILRDLSREFNPTMRLWVGPQLFVFISDPDDLETVMKCSDKWVKSCEGYSRLFQGRGLVALNGEEWRRHRKIMSQAFHYSAFSDFARIFHSKSQILAQRLEKYAGSSSSEFDVLEYISLCTFDMVCETLLGVPTDAQRTSDDLFLKSIEDMNGVVYEMFTKPWLQHRLVFRFCEQRKIVERASGHINRFVAGIIAEKGADRKIDVEGARDLNCNKRSSSFLDLMNNQTSPEKSLSEEDVKNEIVTFIISGYETTATAMSFCLVLLGLHQDIQDRVVLELSDIFQDDPRRDTSHEDLRRMEYLEQVIKETLRLYPVLPVVDRQLATDVDIKNYTLPKGCVVLLNFLHTHRNPEYFPHPEKFNPDHFSATGSEGRHPYAFVPFSGGARSCIGYKYALLQMKMALSSVLRRYVILPAEKEQDMDSLDCKITLRRTNGFKVKISSRL